MSRNISEITKKDMEKILKKQGMRKEEFLNYNPESRAERIVLEVGLMSRVNELLSEYGAAMVLQGMDREGNYLFRIIKK